MSSHFPPPVKASPPRKIAKTPLGDVADRVDRVDAKVNLAITKIEARSRDVAWIAARTEAMVHKLEQLEVKVDRLGKALERFGWVVVGLVGLTLAATVASSLARAFQ